MKRSFAYSIFADVFLYADLEGLWLLYTIIPAGKSKKEERRLSIDIWEPDWTWLN